MGGSQITRMWRRWGVLASLLATAVLGTLSSTAMAATTIIGPPTLSSSGLFVACSSTCVTKTVALISATDPTTVVAIPANGTITGWRVRASLGVDATIHLRVIRPAGSGQFRGVETSDAATVIDGTVENGTSLPVKAGDLIGVDLDASGPSGVGVEMQADLGTQAIWDSPGLGDGITSPPSTVGNNGLPMLNATLEFGGATTTKLSVKTKGSAIRADGLVKPFAAGQELKLTLSRKQHGKFKKVDSAHPALNTAGKYSSEFPRPKSGTCKLLAKYPGDTNFAPSSASKTFGC